MNFNSAVCGIKAIAAGTYLSGKLSGIKLGSRITWVPYFCQRSSKNRSVRSILRVSSI